MIEDGEGTPSGIDIEALGKDLDALATSLRGEVGEDDRQHLFKMVRWSRGCFWLGYMTCSLFPNPLSAFLMSTGNFSRWAMLSHHILHRGYDHIPHLPPRYTSRVYAKGWRRYVDWFDWMLPEAWRHEHNILHHYKLGEIHDPDQPEYNLEALRQSSLPLFLRYLWVLVMAMLWKPFYYAPNTHLELYRARQKKKKKPQEEATLHARSVWLPWYKPGMYLWCYSWLPYFFRTFIVLPFPFLVLGRTYYIYALCNIVLAELLTNLHSFLMIVPNHAGHDVYRFNQPTKDRYGFYLRQIIGSVNYRCGGHLNDFMHGWLNYQIEHHLWPDMTMLQYQKAQSKVKAICLKHNVPYIQESVYKRLIKLLNVMVGKDSMPIWQDDIAVKSK